MQSPAAERNREPIREVLAKYLAHVTGSKAVLEVSSGDGTHVSHFARTLPSSIAWHPTEYDEQVLWLLDPMTIYRKIVEFGKFWCTQGC